MQRKNWKSYENNLALRSQMVKAVFTTTRIAGRFDSANLDDTVVSTKSSARISLSLYSERITTGLICLI